MMDERLDIRTIFNSWTGIGITVVLSLASALSSALVIYLILRSEKKLSQSVFHRIFFGICVADILHYLSMSMSTLPMPTDMIYTGYQGLIIGNDLTCSIQGNLVAFGAFAGFLYNAMLSMYYVCSINYDIHDETFSRRFEPILHAICIGTSLVLVVTGNLGDGLHPNPTSFSWCGLTKYPYWCEGDTCIDSGDSGINKASIIGGVSSMVLSMAVVVFSMIAIACKVRKQEQNVADESNDANNISSRRHSILIRTNILNEKKEVFRQAVGYSIVNVLGFIMVILPQVVTRMYREEETIPAWWQVSYLIMRPLQGSLNSAIFIYHKTHSLQREDEQLNFCEALMMTLTGMEGGERLIADTTIVRRQEALDRLPMARDSSFASVESPTYEGHDLVQENHGTTPAENILQASSSEKSHLSLTSAPEPSSAERSHDLSGFSTTETNTNV